VREEAFKDTLCLPLSRMGKVDPYVHASRSAESRVETLNMVSGSKEETSFRRSYTINAIEKTTQT